jgi:flagellar motor switch protein FliM
VGQIQLGDAMQLRVGDVLELPRETLSRAQIRVATKPRFLATVGIEDSRVVAQIHNEQEKINS